VKLNNFDKTQINLVEFSEKVYHSGLRHKGINGSLYEDKLIKSLRIDIPEFEFYKGQIINNSHTSNQFDVIICKKSTPQKEFLNEVNDIINIVQKENCLGVIELKKWGNPKMISKDGPIESAYNNFKNDFPKLKYLFVCIRFKDRKNNIEKTWHVLENQLNTDGNFCLFGRCNNNNKENEFPWINNKTLILENRKYLGQYKKLIDLIRLLPQTLPK
jgi:hypothetical protein